MKPVPSSASSSSHPPTSRCGLDRTTGESAPSIDPGDNHEAVIRCIEQVLTSGGIKKCAVWDELTQHMPVLLCAWDDTPAPLVWNRECTRVTGFVAEEMVGKKDALQRLYPDPDDRKETIERWSKLDYRFRNHEERWTCRDGSRKIISWTSLPDHLNLSGWKFFAIGMDITDFTQAREMLLQEAHAELRYRELVDHAPICIHEIDLAGKFTSINRAGLDFLGIDKDEDVIGTCVFDIVLEEERDRLRGHFEKALAGESSDFEFTAITRRGHRQFSSNFVPIRNDAGQVSKIMGITRDTTEQGIVAARLQESEERYRTLIESSPVPIQLHCDGKFVYVNDAAVRALGGESKQDFIGKQILDFVHEDWEQIVTNRVSSIYAKQNQAEVLEEKFIRLDGQVIDVEVSGTITDYGGIPACLVVFRDISDRKKAERDLRESEERSRVIFEEAGIGVATCALGGEILRVNRKLCDLFGYSPEEFAGRSIYDLNHPDNRQVSVQKFWEFVESGQNRHQVGKRFIKKDGSTLWGRLTLTLLRDRNGNPESSIEMIEDITEQKKAAGEKAELQAKLRRAQRLETIGTLAGGIAHDFNNILVPIRGYTELALQDVPKDSRLYTDLEHVLKAANRARDLVKQILMFSRQGEHERRPLHLRKIVSEALQLLRSTLPKSIEIRGKLEEENCLVVADETQIYQVVMNLCTNAFQAMQNVDGVLEVSLTTADLGPDRARPLSNLSEGRYVVLEVSDTGHGMDEVTLDRVFEPFFSTRNAGEGSGLGLSVAHGIVTGHGGAVAIESRQGIGTSVFVYLPWSDLEVAEEEPNNAPVLTGTEQILFVDDEIEIANLGSDMLKRLGYRVSTFTSSTEALKQFESSPDEFDLIITDQTMPELSGLELSRRLLRIRPEIPIVLMTGYSEGVSQKRVLDAGIKRYLMKPIPPRELASAIRDVLDGTAKEV